MTNEQNPMANESQNAFIGRWLGLNCNSLVTKAWTLVIHALVIFHSSLVILPYGFSHDRS